MSRTRTFLAIDAGPAVRSAAVAVQKLLATSGAAVNWVEPANLHLTLLFLGEVDDRDLPAVCRAAAAAAAAGPPFGFRVAGLGAFPNSRRPRTVWAGVADGAADIVRLHGRLETALLASGMYRREERAFTPHLTLGRVTAEEDAAKLAAELPQYLAWAGGQGEADEVRVYGSELRRAGAGLHGPGPGPAPRPGGPGCRAGRRVTQYGRRARSSTG